MAPVSSEYRQSPKGFFRKEANKMTNLKGLKVAILVENGFERVELTEPRKALDQAGAETHIVWPQSSRVRAWKLTDWGDKFPVDTPLDQTRMEDFDALH
jgi:protease I